MVQKEKREIKEKIKKKRKKKKKNYMKKGEEMKMALCVSTYPPPPFFHVRRNFFTYSIKKKKICFVYACKFCYKLTVKK